jgi:hypothetical protein
MSFVSGLKVILNNDSVPSGYKKIDFDLNKGAEGEFIWLCYKRSDNESEAIRALFIADDEQPNPPAGYQKIDVDLNAGAGGKFIWLCYTKNAGIGKPLTDIIVGGSGAPSPEYTKLDYDLNKGAGGEFIYIYYKQ